MALKNKFPFYRWSSSQTCWYMTDNVDIRKKVGFALKTPSAFTSAKIYPVNRPALLDLEKELKLKAYSSNTAKVYLGEFS